MNNGIVLVDAFPEVTLFLTSHTIQRVHLVKSNGIQLLCIFRGVVCLVPMSDVRRVSPLNNDTFVCRYDEATYSIVAKRTRDGSIYNTGPVRGRPDPCVDLAAVAKTFGIPWGALPGSEAILAADNASEFITAVSPAEEAKALSSAVVEDALSGATMTIDEIDMPVFCAPVFDGAEEVEAQSGD